MMISVGIIGFGVAARTFHFPFINHCPDYRITAVVSRHPVPELKYCPFATQYSDIDSMLAEAEIDLAVITAPNAVHYALAKRCLEAGKHVVLEKPMVNHVAEGIALRDLANRRGVLLSAFHNRRWDSDFLTVQKLIAAGQLGQLRLFCSHWDRFRPQYQNRWRENPGAGSGIWYDLGTHLVDQVLMLFGMPEAVTGHCRALRAQSPTIDYAHVQLHYASFEVVLHISPFTCAPNFRFCIEGDKGNFVKYGLDIQERQLKSGLSLQAPEYGVTPKEEDGRIYDAAGHSKVIKSERGNFAAYYQNIAAAITGHAALAVTATDAIRVIALLELAQKSSDTGRTLAVSPEVENI